MRYILFAGSNYYPNEGAYDINCASNDLNYLLRLIDKDNGLIDPKSKERYINEGYPYDDDWWQIYDTDECKIIMHGWIGCHDIWGKYIYED